jgi:hypothetical protein
LLSRRCSSRIDGPELIEYWLAFHGTNLKNSMLILGEAYSRCRVPETRWLLAAAVRRSFAEFGIAGDTDEEYVANAMRWYEKNQNELVVNQAYTLNETSHGGTFTIEAYESHPEFYTNPPGVRDPLFRRGADRSTIGGFRWLPAIQEIVVLGAGVAIFALCWNARTLKKAHSA